MCPFHFRKYLFQRERNISNIFEIFVSKRKKKICEKLNNCRNDTTDKNRQHAANTSMWTDCIKLSLITCMGKKNAFIFILQNPIAIVVENHVGVTLWNRVSNLYNGSKVAKGSVIVLTHVGLYNTTRAKDKIILLKENVTAFMKVIMPHPRCVKWSCWNCGCCTLNSIVSLW